MGTYDTLNLPNTPADGEQVKLWYCEMITYKPGDYVPFDNPLSETYGVVCQGGGVAVVRDGRLIGWTPWPMEKMLLFDKWGRTWEESIARAGMFGSPYFHSSEEYKEWTANPESVEDLLKEKARIVQEMGQQILDDQIRAERAAYPED